MELLIIIDIDGTISSIYDDALANLCQQGNTKITRMSNVEPCIDSGWNAIMYDGIILGPFPLRQTALNAEIQYIKTNYFGVI